MKKEVVERELCACRRDRESVRLLLLDLVDNDAVGRAKLSREKKQGGGQMIGFCLDRLTPHKRSNNEDVPCVLVC